MAHQRNMVAWTTIGTLLSVGFPIAGTAIAGLCFPEFRLMHLPLHALAEGAGGLIALAIVGILMAERGRREDMSHYPLMAAGFVSMGVLDLFHAASTPGNHFVWLHSTATFAGGLFFGLQWVPNRFPQLSGGLRLPLAVTILSVLIGAISIMSPGLLPEMRTPEGTFSATAMMLNLCGGIGFLLASAFFVRRFMKSGNPEDWLFGVQSLLFGGAGVLFTYSVVWDGAWWWWHVLRLAAYVAALLYGLRTFRDTERELRRINQQMITTNAALDRTVEERTAKLRASEERFELAVRGSTDGLWDWNPRTNKVFFSPRMKELLGYSDEELPDEFSSFETRLHPADHDWVLQAVNSHLQDRTPYDVEYRLRTKSGVYRWFRARGQAVWNEAGQPLRMAGSITDVTEEHRLRERFRLAVEASPAALLMMSDKGIIMMANSLTLTLFGYAQAELIGQPIEVLIPERFRAAHPAHRNKFFENPSQRAMGADLELLGVRKDGSEFPVKVGLSPIETAEGKAVICGVMDITDQKKTLEAMRLAKVSAESASRAKSSFLANMSHEIRTPMNGIIGMAQLLSQTELRSHQRDYLSTVVESAHILLRLLNDILDFSKIEAGKLELESVDFRISECIARTSQMLVLRAAEKGLEFACRIAPEIPDYLRGDPGRVQQILVNLIGNAVKFTESGEIFVNVDAESISVDRVRLHFSVHDTGIGIRTDKLEHIFHPFEQAESSTTRRFGGTGLGLAISRQLVEMMHGKMWVESKPDAGSTFHFTAEFGVAANQHQHLPAELNSLQDLPVLVVDDNFTNRRILGEMLHYWHMRPLLVDSAAAARQALRSAAEQQHPIRLILLDHHMPVEDGLHFAESILGTVNRDFCPIIMISSGSSLIDANLCEKYGISRFMTKPVIASELLNEVLRQFGRSMNVNPVQPPTATLLPKAAPRRILLVEDNEINRRVALGLLNSRGHQTVVATNGQEAVDMLANQEFDVVLMDMQMPIMDGYEATVEIRRRERQMGGHIPIVAMTAEALKGDRERCLETGMDDYVSKPIAPKELYRAIEQFPAVCLQMNFAVQESAKLEQPLPHNPLDERPFAAVTSSRSNASPDKSGTDTVPAVDWIIAKKMLGNDRETLAEFSELLKTETPLRVAEIRRAIETRDSRLLCRAAHTLKGASSYFGTQILTQAALDLEQLGHDESFVGAVALLDTLEREFARVVTALDIGPPDITS